MDAGIILGFILSLSFGFIPTFLFAYILYWIDRYEKEPNTLLGGVFLWGAIIAAGMAFFFNTILGIGVYLFTGSESATNLTTGSLIAPIVEESLKGFAVLIVFLIFRKEFDSIIDGIVYAGVCALGFAASENTYYIFNIGYLEGGLTGAIFLIFVRVILVGWQHPFYTSFIGIGLAITRLNRKKWIKFLAPLTGWSLAVLTHSFHNTLAAIISGSAGLTVGTLLDWSGWFVMLIFILWALYREQQWIVHHLREEVTLGIITPAQYRIACSAWAQSYSKLLALFSGRFRVTQRFYQLTAELAYKKHQSETLGETENLSAKIHAYRATLSQLSRLVQT